MIKITAAYLCIIQILLMTVLINGSLHDNVHSHSSKYWKFNMKIIVVWK